jgi:hypothetical protein
MQRLEICKVGEIGDDVSLGLKMSMRMKEDLGVKEDMRGTEGVGMV